MSKRQIDSDQWNELLAGRVLADLSEQELNVIQDVGLTDDDQQTLIELETTMARVQLALQKDSEPMPESLRRQILENTSQHLAEAGDTTDTRLNSDRPEPGGTYGQSTRTREYVAWLACAAALLLAFGFWNAQPRPPMQLTATEMRNDLIDNATDLVRVSWTEGKHPFPTEVRGDVVWSSENQTGFMTFEQMPVNQPTKEQYQLWIIDPERDDEPIDGGVFDIASTGEVIVPINAKLRVLKPAAFAITIEKPGGVVVSTQERLPLLAAVN